MILILDEVDAGLWPQWEVAYIQFFREQGFNLVNGNAGGEGGHVPTPETRFKIGAAKIGKKPHNFGKPPSAETRAKQRAAKLGKHHSVEHCEKMSAALTGEKNPFFGRQHSAETRAKMRAAWVIRKQKHEN